MAIICTRCQGTGFLNIEQIPNERDLERKEILEWIKRNTGHDVQVCDCCGDGDDWHGEPGQHYNTADPRGREGPYAYNGGLCECN